MFFKSIHHEADSSKFTLVVGLIGKVSACGGEDVEEFSVNPSGLATGVFNGNHGRAFS